MTGIPEKLLEGFAADDPPLKPNEYRCASCVGVFEKAWSDEEAKTELATNFPGFEPDDCDLVCDDCYQKLMNGSQP